ncbi:hypothetical protein FS837_007358 [Tulasnella sp. UAMH 9824]|nr:hypothetical protein FS837_007358 [Tulasnella sp. UAMH 9824]
MRASLEERLSKIMDELAGIVDEIASTSKTNGDFAFACAKMPAWDRVAGALRVRATQNLRDRNALLPVHQLPVEVLARILEGAVDGETYRYYRQLTLLRGVCYRWQEVVDDTPWLWTRIRGGDSIRLVEEALKKSSTHPLDVSVRSQFYFQPDKLAAFFEKLEPHLNRLKTVDVTYSGVSLSEDWFTTIKLFTSPQPSLERFSLSNEYFQRDLSELTLFANHAPRLKDLQLEKLCIDCRGAGFGRLSSLTLSVVTVSSLKDLLGTISRCGSLLFLRLDQIFFQNGEDDPPPQRISLPVLRNLSLGDLRLTVKERLLRDIHPAQSPFIGLSLQLGPEALEEPVTRHLPRWLLERISPPPGITRVEMKITERWLVLSFRDSADSERSFLFLSHDESVAMARAGLIGVDAFLKSHTPNAEMHLTLSATALHLAEDEGYVEQLRCLSQVITLQLGESWFSWSRPKSDGAQSFQLPLFPRLRSLSFCQQPSECIIKVVKMLSAAARPGTGSEGGGMMVNIYVLKDSELNGMSSTVEEVKEIVGAERVSISIISESMKERRAL